ncbi:MAG: hypothetical protein ABF586_09250 [Sporolactobacillus sp.]
MRFQLSGIFLRQNFELELPVGGLDAATGEAANAYARNADLGRVFYAPAARRLCYLKTGAPRRVLDGTDVRCGIRQLGAEGKPAYSRPALYQVDDFQEVSFAIFLDALARTQHPTHHAFFECIAYALTPVEWAQKGGIPHADR